MRTVVPAGIMLAAKSAVLFSFIATEIQAFLQIHHPEHLEQSSHHLPVFHLGFTFSFPVYQTGINSGTLLRWTKGFEIPDTPGKDVCQLLQCEIDNLHLPVKVTALINDAAGTIMSRAYSLPPSSIQTSIGMILGTGTNAVYVEKLANITKPLPGRFDDSTGSMLISIEWGSFDNKLAVLPCTSFDAELDSFSANPGNQIFEKRVSGMFLGELLRLTLVALYDDASLDLFKGTKDAQHTPIDMSGLRTRWSVDSTILSMAEADNSSNLQILKQAIQEAFGIWSSSVTLEEAKAVKKLAHAIGTRAGRLAGMSTAAVVLKTGLLEKSGHIQQPTHSTEVNNSGAASEAVMIGVDSTAASKNFDEDVLVDIAFDGSVIEFYPGFDAIMRRTYHIIPGIGPAGEKKIKFGLAKDGSSVGAAIIALLATNT